MKHARISLRFPPSIRHPMQSFLQESVAVHREELWAWDLHGDALVALFYVDGDVDAYREAIETVDTIDVFDLTPAGDDAFYTYVREDRRDADRSWMAAFDHPSLIVVPPVVYRSDGDTVFTVVGTTPDLQALVADLPNEISFVVDRIGAYDHRHTHVPPPALTTRQHEAVATALELGYYDRPRSASLADVATTLSCATGTASELLRRAEHTALSQVVDGRSEPTH